MRTIGILALLAIAMAAPVIMADPNAQMGSQTGRHWSQGTAVSVQGGTGFVLLGAVGDHDIFFYNANGALVGLSIACGPEIGGTVPASAVVGVIRPWDHIGAVVPECLSPVDPAPSSTWVYADGL